MTDLELRIKSLQQHIQLLVKRSRQLEKENQQLQLEAARLREQQEKLKQDLEITGMQNAMLKAAQQHLSEPEKKEMEKKLQGFIKEIDHCIALLSR